MNITNDRPVTGGGALILCSSGLLTLDDDGNKCNGHLKKIKKISITLATPANGLVINTDELHSLQLD